MYKEYILLFCIGVNQIFFIESLNGETFLYSKPSHCDRGEYFNSVLLKCLPCEANKHLEPSADKLSCVCNKRSKIVSTVSVTIPICEPCRNNEVLSSDKRFCIPCSNQVLELDNTTVCEKCSSHQIRVERELNGSLKNVHCLNCTNDTFPSFDGKQCVPCNITFAQGAHCKCPDKSQKVVDGICMPNSILIDFPHDPNTFLVTYDSGIKVDSIFLRMYLRKSLHLCKEKNITACQICANMCTMLMYDISYKSSPCRLFHDLKQEVNLKSNMLPWIYYGEGDAPAVVSRKKIASTFTLDLNSENSQLNLTAVHFSAHGILTDISTDVGTKIQLCPESWNTLNSGFLFGHRYQHTCTITAKQLFNSRQTEFLELYLQYWKEGESLLYAIPLLVLNLKGGRNNNNKAADNTQWLLTRRFFLIDKISGISADIQKSTSEIIPSVVQYMKHCTLKVKLLGSEDEGHIYPPLLVIEYGELTSKDINENIPVTLSFQVEYEMSSTFSHSVEVAMGVLCGLSVVWSVIETWSNSRRSGRVAVDLFTLIQLCLFACGNLSNVFFLVVSSASLYHFVFYKGQSVVQIILPSQSEDDLIKSYIIIAFTLKIIEVIHFIAKQVSIDIFFIDWERPRARSSIVHPNSISKKNEVNTTEQPVSIWRTYFVANEWNEIQTKRKINIICQMIITVFILKVLGVEYWALANPELQTELSDVTKKNPPSLVFRFAVGVCMYTFVYSLQWLFVVLIYERYVKNGIQEFVDICSMANVSVFILVLENYGFYIHGRSPHGFADTDMQSMTNQLQREEEDLCGHRGLLPGTDQQTFQMTVPTQLRAYYRKVITPISSMMQINKRLSMAGGFRAKLSAGNIDKSIQAYHNMNKFLAAFFEHALKDLDYEVRDKLFMESLLDIEFTERLDKGVLYNDNGHSFDRILFYGSEYTLSTFEILTFSFVEVIYQNYLLAAIVTAVLSKIVTVIRSVAGRRNLVKKTLIDERFLV